MSQEDEPGPSKVEVRLNSNNGQACVDIYGTDGLPYGVGKVPMTQKEAKDYAKKLGERFEIPVVLQDGIR